jgi:hypothetical protein
MGMPHNAAWVARAFAARAINVTVRIHPQVNNARLGAFTRAHIHSYGDRP